MSTPNPFEQRARVRKAQALIEALDAQCFSPASGVAIPARFQAEIVAEFTDTDWAVLVDAAGVNSPSAVTKDAVVLFLGSRAEFQSTSTGA